jgi:hypothetical protein
VELDVPLTVDSDGDPLGLPDLPDFDDPAVDALLDTDGDGIPNARDADDDDDGIPTRDETGVETAEGRVGFPCGPWAACGPSPCEDAAIRFDVDGDGFLACAGLPDAPLDVAGYRGWNGGDPDWLHFDPNGASDLDGDCIVDDRDPVDDGPLGDLDGDGWANDFECTTPDWNPLTDDMDGDGVTDDVEGLTDTDGDGTPDRLETDDDGDGIPTLLEAGDADGDGIPDSRELDSDADGIPDAEEAVDADCDGLADRVDPVAGSQCDAAPGNAGELTHVRQGCACDGAAVPGPGGALVGVLGVLAGIARRRSAGLRP